MQVCRLKIANFRGIKSATVELPKHGVLIGDNNAGKTTILEAIDLVLGPDRLNRISPIDEHDFFQGKYVADAADETDESVDAVADAEDGGADSAHAEAFERTHDEPPRIEIEVIIADLSEEQKGTFADYIEFWDSAGEAIYDKPEPGGLDSDTITEALRVTFLGQYDPEEDGFEGKTYFTRSLTESDRPDQFSKMHKRICGFLYLRSLRTGSRAMSLERGSLLDIILRLKEVRPLMWEDTIKMVAGYSVASDPDLGISGVLESINRALTKYVPREWGVKPRLKVSNLTREHLRKVITAFIATGEGSHSAPFYRQGTGTINMLVLAMLSQIAEDKQNVIFAMEEPETAIPPYAQKRIVHEIRKLASQTIFTSHSPYVLEEFALDETVVLDRDTYGTLRRAKIALPDMVKPKRYRQEFRTRFCEGLLARRILVAEGATEAASIPVVCRRLAELNPDTYSSLEALGVCTIDAGGEMNIPGLAKLYRDLHKQIFSICDRQSNTHKACIEACVDVLFMHEERGLENLVLKNTTGRALRRFKKRIEWPAHLKSKYEDPEADAVAALREYFDWAKGNWAIADFLAQCAEDEIPQWLRDTSVALKTACTPSVVDEANGGAPASPVVVDVWAGSGVDAAH